MILRFQNVRGFRLFRRGRQQLELWLAPRGAVIPMHVHRHCSSRVTFLGGRMVWYLGEKAREFSARDFCMTKNIPAGTAHGAFVTGLFGIFANWETWDCEPSSAADDFVRV